MDFHKLEPSQEKLDELTDLVERLTLNPYTLADHIKYIEILREIGEIDELRRARARMIQYIAPSHEVWEEWLGDEKNLYNVDASTENAFCALFFAQKRALLEQSMNAWQAFAKIVQAVPEDILEELRKSSLAETLLSVNDKIATCDSARDLSARHSYFLFAHSMARFMLGGAKDFLDLLLDIECGTSTDWETVTLSERSKVFIKKLFLDQLQVPHLHIEDTFSSFSNFLTNKEPGEYEGMIFQANSIYSSSLKYLPLIEQYELQLANTTGIENIRAVFDSYLNSALSAKITNDDLVCSVFERAQQIFTTDVGIWADFILFFTCSRYSPSEQDRMRFQISERACKFCPSSGILQGLKLQSQIQAIDDTNEKIVIIERNMIEAMNDCINYRLFDHDINEALAFCELLYESLRASYAKHCKQQPKFARDSCTSGFISNVSKRFSSYFHNVFSRKKIYDNTCRREIAEIGFLQAACLYDEAQGIWNRLQKHHYRESQFWIQRAISEEECGSSPTNTLCAAMYKKLDSHQLLFAHVAGIIGRSKNISDIQKLKFNLNFASRMFQGELIPTQDYSNLKDEAELNDSAETCKRRYVADSNDSFSAEKRVKIEKNKDRENLTIIVEGLPLSISDSQLEKFFSDCGPIESVQIKQNASLDCSTAALVFTCEQDVLAALTKDYKNIEGHELSVKRMNTTLFVTGYHPTWGPDDVRRIFSEIGSILDVRMPSLTINTRRRFCYVQMCSEKDVKSALRLDGKEIEGHILSVKRSDPEKKKAREGPVHEKREIYIRNVDFKIGRQELEDFFSREIGGIESIKLPTKPPQHRLHYGYAYIVFETPDLAEKSLQLNGKLLGSRILNIIISEYQNKSSNQAKRLLGRASIVTKDDALTSERSESANSVVSRSVGVMNISPSTSAARLQALFEKYGAVVRTDNYPERGIMIVEFETVKAAGDAEMALQSIEVDGSRLQIRSVNDAMSSRGLVPAAVRRRVPPMLGIKKPESTQSSSPAHDSSLASRVTAVSYDPLEKANGQKSNADFRRLYVN